MNIRETCARLGADIGENVGTRVGGIYLGAFMRGVGASLGGAMPYIAVATAMRVAGFPRAAGVVVIVGACDPTPFRVL